LEVQGLGGDLQTHDLLEKAAEGFRIDGAVGVDVGEEAEGLFEAASGRFNMLTHSGEVFLADFTDELLGEDFLLAKMIADASKGFL